MTIPSPCIGSTVYALLDRRASNRTSRRVGPLRCQAACAVILSSGAPTYIIGSRGCSMWFYVI
jgi:hypothetical protein